MPNGNPLVATAAMRELGYLLPLADALALTLLRANESGRRFERAAVRWHGRLCLEVRDLTAADADLTLAALRGLTEGNRHAAAESLGAVLEAVGQQEAARLVEEWAKRRTPLARFRAGASFADLVLRPPAGGCSGQSL